MKKALVTGITGQDGSYLAEFLLAKGYEVNGVIRRASTFNTRRIDHLFVDPHLPGVRLFLHFGDLSNTEWVAGLLHQIRPDEVYHLGAQTHVRVSFDLPEYTGDVTGLGTTRLLEAIHRSGITTRFYQASSSEMFGDSPAPQDENTPFRPRSPYAAAKLYSHWVTRMYREAYGQFAATGILFNHESPRRGETFVTRKITRGLALILAGKQQQIFLGNLDAKRDWGYAPEYVAGMWQILQADKPDDYVLGTGECHAVREFLEQAFQYVDRDWREHVVIDPSYFRALEVAELRAQPEKARQRLNWSPQVTFRELVRIMVDADLEQLGLPSPGEGKRILREKFPKWHHWQNAVVDTISAIEGRNAV